MKYMGGLISSALLFCSVFSAQAAVTGFETARPDGSSIHWSLDIPQDRVGQVGLVVIMQGSGCESITKSGSLKLTRLVFSDFAALTVEKYGVTQGDDGVEKDGELVCPLEYYASNTNSQRVVDYVTIQNSHIVNNTLAVGVACIVCPLEYYASNTNSQRVVDYVTILNSLSSAQWWNGQLVIIGGSEGGDIAARVSAQVHPQAVVMISSGGGITFEEVVQVTIRWEMERNEVPREQWPDVDGIFARARANPQSAQVEGGYSYKYWADSIDRRTVDDMLKIAAPMLLIQGTADTSLPLYDARAAVDIFTDAKRGNLTYWEKAGYSHGMVDAGGTNRLEEVLQEARFWVQSKLALDKPALAAVASEKQTIH